MPWAITSTPFSGTMPRRETALRQTIEGLQPIGSFKLRGAFNKIAQLSAQQRDRGVITYSSGNHAQGVAYAARELGIKAVIVMPSNAPQVKVEATQALGAEIVTVGPASLERKARAEELAAITEHDLEVVLLVLAIVAVALYIVRG